MTDTSISYGNKYNDKLDTAEIAKLVRVDIKAAVKSGELPKGLKTSVRIDRFSGGSSIRVTIKAAPVVILNPVRLQFERDTPHKYCNLDVYTEEATALQHQLERMLGAYNFDGSDRMTDYFHVNFWGSVDWDHNLTSEERRVFNAAAAEAEEVHGASEAHEKPDAHAPLATVTELRPVAPTAAQPEETSDSDESADEAESLRTEIEALQRKLEIVERRTALTRKLTAARREVARLTAELAGLEG